MTSARSTGRATTVAGAARTVLAVIAALLATFAFASLVTTASAQDGDDHAPLTSTTPAVAPKTTLEEVEKELMCSTCRVPLAQSNAPQAQQERKTIERLIAEGKTKDEIIDEMVEIYSESVLIHPPEKNVRTLRWLVPTVAALLGFAIVAWVVARWRRAARRNDTTDETWGDAADRTAPSGAPDDGDDWLSDADRARLNDELDRYA